MFLREITYTVKYDHDEGRWSATCDANKALFFLGETPTEALSRLDSYVIETRNDILGMRGDECQL